MNASITKGPCFTFSDLLILVVPEPCHCCQDGTTNLITRALAAVGRSIESIPDPTQIHYRLPKSAAHPLVSHRPSQFAVLQ